MSQRKARFIIVEDDSIMGMEMTDIIESFGYEVLDVVDSGAAAIKSVKRYEPDMILMDIRLKGDMDGIEASRQIRSFTQKPITFITGYKDNGTVQRAAMISNSVFLTKPVDFDQLRISLQQNLSNSI